MKFCLKCMEQINLFASRCPHCHADQNDGNDEGIGFFGWIAIIAVVLYFIFA